MAPRETFPVDIGINPIGWSNDDLPSLGGDTPLSIALAEGCEIGYAGFELGHKFPREPEALRELMAEYDLNVISGWYSGELVRRTVDEEIAAVQPHLRLLERNGCKVMVYGEVANSIQGRQSIPLYKRPKFVDQDAFNRYAEKLTAFGRYLLTHGIRLAYHHHMGAYVQSPADIDSLMTLTGPEVGLVFDSGHAYFGGDDPVALLRRHINRVCHVHCKSVRPALIQLAWNRQWSFLTAVVNGVFTVPGDGAIDFAPIIRVLRESAYRGWLVVEAEQDPAIAPSYAFARKGYRTLRVLVDDKSFEEVV